MVLKTEHDHAEMEHQAILDAEHHQLVQTQHALLEAHAVQERDKQLEAGYLDAIAKMKERTRGQG